MITKIWLQKNKILYVKNTKTKQKGKYTAKNWKNVLKKKTYYLYYIKSQTQQKEKTNIFRKKQAKGKNQATHKKEEMLIAIKHISKCYPCLIKNIILNKKIPFFSSLFFFAYQISKD